MIGIPPFADLLRLAAQNVRRHALRSLLTVLGIVFGVASVLAMLAVGAGAQEEILRQIGRLGVRNVILASQKPAEESRATGERQWINRYGLTYRDLGQIRDTVPGIEKLLPVKIHREQIWYGSKKIEAQLLGILPDHLQVLPYRLRLGRRLTAMDNRDRKRVCLVRAALLNEMGRVGDPLRAELKVGKQYYRVVGILADETYSSPTQKALGLDPRAHEVYAPYETVVARRGLVDVTRRTGSFEANRVELDQIVVVAAADAGVETMARNLASILQHNHEDLQDYEMIVPLELLRQREKTQRVFNLVMILIASISLLVGGIGIMNIMLATVTERTREIGVRRALGASQGDIVRQFLVETVFLSGLGGVAGIALGLLAVQWLARFTGWEAVVTPLAVGLAFTISCFVGILFGIWPARRASLLDPITALRYE